MIQIHNLLVTHLTQLDLTRLVLTSEQVQVLYNAACASIDMHQSRNSCCELGFVIKQQEKLETSCC